MATIAPPKYVRQILFTLQGHGYPAYLVGGWSIGPTTGISAPAPCRSR